jgi:cytoskeletal protein RodZ
MNTPTRTPANTEAPAPGSSKTLWAALLVLVVVVLAMGAALIRIQSRPVEPRLVWVGQHGDVTPAVSAASAAVAPSSAASSAPTAATSQPPNKAPAQMGKASDAISNEASHSAIEITAKPRPVLTRTPEPAVLRPPSAGESDTNN